VDFVDNCYLIHHAQGWLLWDTGVADAIAAMPDGQAPADPKATHWRRPKTLASQLEGLGVKPADIKYVAVSHTHPDQAVASPVNKLQGDHDVFGDGSVTIIATPGHTPRPPVVVGEIAQDRRVSALG
jgi:N-acyl homoserine lactone hydrolase